LFALLAGQNVLLFLKIIFSIDLVNIHAGDGVSSKV
jgi:hypothetical protein